MDAGGIEMHMQPLKTHPHIQKKKTQPGGRELGLGRKQAPTSGRCCARLDDLFATCLSVSLPETPADRRRWVDQRTDANDYKRNKKSLCFIACPYPAASRMRLTAGRMSSATGRAGRE